MTPIATIRLALLAGAALFLTSCAKTPVSTSRTNNPDVPVALLFEKDGVKVYRFTDLGRYIYYTDARGATTWETGGKASVLMNVETVK